MRAMRGRRLPVARPLPGSFWVGFALIMASVPFGDHRDYLPVAIAIGLVGLGIMTYALCRIRPAN